MCKEYEIIEFNTCTDMRLWAGRQHRIRDYGIEDVHRIGDQENEDMHRIGGDYGIENMHRIGDQGIEDVHIIDQEIEDVHRIKILGLKTCT